MNVQLKLLIFKKSTIDKLCSEAVVPNLSEELYRYLPCCTVYTHNHNHHPPDHIYTYNDVSQPDMLRSELVFSLFIIQLVQRKEKQSRKRIVTRACHSIQSIGICLILISIDMYTVMKQSCNCLHTLLLVNSQLASFYGDNLLAFTVS